MSILKDLLIPLIFSLLLSIVLLPICNKLEKWRFPRPLAIITTILIFLGFLFLLIYAAYTQIVDFEDVLPQLTEKGEILFKNIQKFISQNFHIGRKRQIAEGQKYVTEFVKANGDIFTAIFSTTTNLLANLSLVPLYVFLLLYYRDFYRRFLYKLLSGQGTSRYRVDIVLRKIKQVMQSYVSGLMIVIAIVGSLNTLGLWLLGIDYAVFFGFFAGFLVLIPYIGIAVGSLLPILMALITKDSAWYALGVAGLFGGVQFLEGNFITPYIVGSKVSINSMTAIIALILFGQLWGMAGLVLAMPLTAMLKVLFDNISPLRPFGFLLGDADDVK
jgi:predicted PurR-regulated permease PerM